jgi:hypothetical protein
MLRRVISPSSHVIVHGAEGGVIAGVYQPVAAFAG